MKKSIFAKVFATLALALVIALCAKQETQAADFTLALNDSFVSGNITSGTVHDYTIVLTSPSKLHVVFQGQGVRDCYYQLYNYDMTTQFFSHEIWYSSETSPKTADEWQFLEAGTYKIRITPYGNNSGTYMVKAAATALNNTESEPNNTFPTAMPLGDGYNVKGLFTRQDRIDFYKFTVSTKTKLQFVMVSTVHDMYITLYDKDTIELKKWEIYYGSEATPKSWNTELVLDPGTYYIKATPYGGNDFGTYDFKWIKNIIVSSIKLSGKKTLELNKSALFKATISPSNATDKTVTWASSNTNVAYVDSTGRVTARSCGTANITATAKDGSGRVGTYKVTVIPTKMNQPYIYGNRSYIYLSWNTQPGVKGYQIQYSTASTFKGAKTVKISNPNTHYRYFRYLPKGKRYYFRIRAYFKTKYTTYYSTWSKKCYAKVK